MSLPPISIQDSTLSSFSSTNLRHGDLLAGKVARIESNGNALLTFPQGKAVADAKALVPGAQIFACVRRNNLNTEILLLPSLKPGETHTATVLSSRSSELLVKLGEAELLVQMKPEDAPPQPGTLVRVQLQPGRPVLQLAPTPAPPAEAMVVTPETQLINLLAPKYVESLSVFLRNAPAMIDCFQSLLALLQGLPKNLLRSSPRLEGLLRVLESMRLNPADEDLGPRLASSTVNSGAFLEARLNAEREQPIQNDLKLALLQAIEEMSSKGADKGNASPSLPGQVAQQAQHLLEMLRGEQLLNLRLLPSRQIYIQLPLAQSSGLKAVEILISPEKDAGPDGPKRKSATLNITVSTTKLGKLKATISISNRVMACQFRTKNKWVADLIEHHAETLKHAFEKLDYQVAHVGCSVTSEERELDISADLSALNNYGVNICA